MNPISTEASKNRRGDPAGERIILGIDPGTTVMGYGVVLAQGSKLVLLDADAVRFTPGDDHAVRLRAIFRAVLKVIEKHLPDELAIEAQFFGKNVQSMLKLGRAQGVAIAAALHRDIPVVEYAPRRVKQSITGRGDATKEQVAAMLGSIFAGQQLPRSTDATDALAVALCHHFSSGSAVARSAPRSGGRKGDWSDFVRNNPGRVKT